MTIICRYNRKCNIEINILIMNDIERNKWYTIMSIYIMPSGRKNGG